MDKTFPGKKIVYILKIFGGEYVLSRGTKVLFDPAASS